ncbi:MAG: glycosyltransferase family 4 protein [Pyrinomonadaceae bacterium]|nr:glycosyltransferase family 4 protein [Pyrinomonadaceae bacterium]
MKDSSGKKKTLWVVTELYYPEETSTGYYLTRTAEGLADEFEVKVLCGQPNYSARGTRAPKHEVHKNVEIFRAFGTTLDKNVIFFRLINMLTLSFSIFWKALRKFKKGEQVLVVTTPPSLPFITALASLLKGSQYILLIHDNYPEILVAVKKAKEDSIFVRFLNFCNRWLYKYAAKIIVVGRDMKILVEKKTEGLDIPIEIIPNWAELETVEPREREQNELLSELRLLDKLVFLYAGNMGHPNDMESIVQCAESLVENKEIHFIFLGTGVKRKWLEKEIGEKKLINVTVLDPKPRSEQNIFLNACDVAFVSLVPKMWGVSMPSRTYNILAAGKPILALSEKDSEISKVVLEDNLGWVVPPHEPIVLRECILEISEKKDLLKLMGNNARITALAEYSLPQAIKRYKKALL